MLQTARNHTEVATLRTEYETFAVHTLTPHIGAEIGGVDLSRPLSEPLLRDLRSAWLDWKVLVFRDQTLDRDQQKIFARHFGNLHVHPLLHGSKGDHEVLKV